MHYFAKQYMFRLLIIKFLLVAFISNAVGQPHTVIIIDTLAGYNEEFAYNSLGSHLLLFTGDCEYPYQTYDESPNLIMVYSDTCDLELLLDNKGGRATLRKLKLHDTIRINKWTVYKNGLPDSIEGSIVYYRYCNDSLVSGPHKEKPMKRYQLHNGITDLQKINIIVNNIPVTVEINIDTTTIITHAHGYKSRRIYRKAMKGWREDKIVKHLRRAIGYDKKVFSFSAELDLKLLHE